MNLIHFYRLGWRVGDVRRAFQLRLSLRIRPGHFVEDCAYRILVVTGISYLRDELVGIDVTTGIEYHCSIEHCGVQRLSVEHVRQTLRSIPDRQPSFAAERVLWQAAYRRAGSDLTDEQVAANHQSFAREWRESTDYRDRPDLD